MDKKIIFIAGSYGVGKTTICNQLANILKIPSYSASDLISKQNKESYGKNKYVKDSNLNQNILVEQVSQIKDEIFIVNGHFCLKAPNNNIILLDKDIFKQLSLEAIVLIESSSELILQNLYNRDQKKYNNEFIDKLLLSEKNQSIYVSKTYNVPLYFYRMKYDGEDLKKILLIFDNILEGVN